MPGSALYNSLALAASTAGVRLLRITALDAGVDETHLTLGALVAPFGAPYSAFHPHHTGRLRPRADRALVPWWTADLLAVLPLDTRAVGGSFRGPDARLPFWARAILAGGHAERSFRLWLAEESFRAALGIRQVAGATAEEVAQQASLAGCLLGVGHPLAQLAFLAWPDWRAHEEAGRHGS